MKRKLLLAVGLWGLSLIGPIARVRAVTTLERIETEAAALVGLMTSGRPAAISGK